MEEVDLLLSVEEATAIPEEEGAMLCVRWSFAEGKHSGETKLARVQTGRCLWKDRFVVEKVLLPTAAVSQPGPSIRFSFCKDGEKWPIRTCKVELRFDHEKKRRASLRFQLKEGHADTILSVALQTKKKEVAAAKTSVWDAAGQVGGFNLVSPHAQASPLSGSSMHGYHTGGMPQPPISTMGTVPAKPAMSAMNQVNAGYSRSDSLDTTSPLEAARIMEGNIRALQNQMKEKDRQMQTKDSELNRLQNSWHKLQQDKEVVEKENTHTKAELKKLQRELERERKRQAQLEQQSNPDEKQCQCIIS